MFTGIVTDIGEVLAVDEKAQDLRRLRIACQHDSRSIDIGASIACSGVCLTVVTVGAENGRTVFAVEAAAETLRRTTLGGWQTGTRVNLERSLRVGDELGGHFVSGHVDGLARVVSRDDSQDQATLVLEAPGDLARFIAAKGSVALDGVSLTVNVAEGSRFSVVVIPHTLAVTTLGAVNVSQALNLEIDMMARYAANLVDAR